MAEAVSPSSPALTPPDPDAKTRKAAKEFEAVFVGQMTKLMLESVEQDDAFSGGHGEAMFRGVLAEQMGAQIARGRGIGMADSVMAEIIRLQQAQAGGE